MVLLHLAWMVKPVAEGKYTKWHRVMEDRRLAEIEERIAQQLALIKYLAMSAHDTSQAEDLLWTLRQARNAAIEQRQINLGRSAADDDIPPASILEQP